MTCTVTIPLWFGLYFRCLRSGPVGFFADLVPKGVPELFGFVIFPIEIVRILCQILSLRVRIMLNMAFGFIIIHVLIRMLRSLVFGRGRILLILIMAVVRGGFLGVEFFVCIIQRGLLIGLVCMYRSKHPARIGCASNCSFAKKRFNS